MNNLLILQEKRQFLQKNVSFLDSSGETLKLLLHDYLKSVLLFRPENVFEYSQEYFSFGKTKIPNNELYFLEEDNNNNDIINKTQERNTNNLGNNINLLNNEINTRVNSPQIITKTLGSPTKFINIPKKKNNLSLNDLNSKNGISIVNNDIVSDQVQIISFQSNNILIPKKNPIVNVSSYPNILRDTSHHHYDFQTPGSIDMKNIILPSTAQRISTDTSINTINTISTISQFSDPKTIQNSLGSTDDTSNISSNSDTSERIVTQIPASLLPSASDFTTQVIGLELPLMENDISIQDLRELFHKSGINETNLIEISRDNVSDLITQFQNKLKEATENREINEKNNKNKVNDYLEAFDIGVVSKKVEKKETTPFYELMTPKNVDVLIDSFLDTNSKKKSFMQSLPYIFIDEFKTKLFGELKRIFGKNSFYTAIVAFTIDMTLPLIADSDVLYHDIDLVIQSVLLTTSAINALSVRESEVNIQYWTHIVVAILCSHVGMCIGALEADIPIDRTFSTATEGEELKVKPIGITNSILIPYRIKRSQKFIEEKFAHSQTLDLNLLKALVASMPFPFPFVSPEEYFSQDIFTNLTKKELGMCRLVMGCDTIIPMCLINAYKRLPRMYHEIEEANLLEQFQQRGIQSMQSFRKSFFQLYWSSSLPYFNDIIGLLELTQNGQVWKSQLFGNIFECYHGILVPSSFSRKHFSKWASIIK